MFAALARFDIQFRWVIVAWRLAIERLEALGLIRRADAVVEARPALVRFTYREAVVT